MNNRSVGVFIFINSCDTEHVNIVTWRFQFRFCGSFKFVCFIWPIVYFWHPRIPHRPFLLEWIPFKYIHYLQSYTAVLRRVMSFASSLAASPVGTSHPSGERQRTRTESGRSWQVTGAVLFSLFGFVSLVGAPQQQPGWHLTIHRIRVSWKCSKDV